MNNLIGKSQDNTRALKIDERVRCCFLGPSHSRKRPLPVLYQTGEYAPQRETIHGEVTLVVGVVNCINAGCV